MVGEVVWTEKNGLYYAWDNTGDILAYIEMFWSGGFTAKTLDKAPTKTLVRATTLAEAKKWVEANVL